MIEKITAANLDAIANPVLRDYARRYVDIEAGFREAVAAFGVPFAERAAGEVVAPAGVTARPAEAAARPAGAASASDGAAPTASAPAPAGLRVLNDGKSLVANWQSSACEVCRLGLGTETFVMTLACPRRCFFCFNPNQADFDDRAPGPRDVVAQLEARAAQGARYTHLALTGGEPLLYPDDTVTFFRRAKELFPGVHTRLYTSGAGLDESLLARLRAVGLDEARFSIKTDDAPKDREAVLGLIRRACAFIPDVMVEMPVMPDEVALMKELLVRLDGFGVRGINLLELGFPFFNGEEFARRGYRLKAEPYGVLYDYAYAAGLPVAGSEEACRELLAFVLDEGLSLGAHYCSMENKHTGQVFQQNAPHAATYPLRQMSPRDHFLKSAKVFGADRGPARDALTAAGAPFQDDRDFDFTEFSLVALPALEATMPYAPVAISYAICEPREGEVVLRELRLDLTTPATFHEADW